MRQEYLVDPNRAMMPQSAARFMDEGKELIGVMRANGINKNARDEMRVMLAKTAGALQKSSRKGMMKEVTSTAHPTYSGVMAQTVGTYYPDEIPVSTYFKMKQDPQVAIGLAMIKLPLLSLQWTVECDDLDVKAFVNSSIQMVWRKLLRSMLTAVEFGFASHEKVWWNFPMQISSTTATGRKKTHFSGKAEVYQKVKPHYPDTIRVRTDEKTGEFLGITQDVGGGQTVSIDKEKCFWFSLEDDFGNYFGSSRLKQAYKPWYWKEVLYQFMLRYYERRGSPPTIITYPPGINISPAGTEIDNSEVALRLGQSLINNSVVTLPFEETKDGRDNQWKVQYMHDEKRGEMFVDSIAHLETQILRGLLVPERTVTQDISTGSYSMAASHAEAFLLAQEGTIASMEEAINAQLIPQLIEFNFKPKAQLPCILHIEEIQHDRKRLLKEIYVEVLRNVNTFAKGGKVPNLMPSLDEMSKVLKVPVVPFEEEYIDVDLGALSNPTPGFGDPSGGSTPPKKAKSTGKPNDDGKEPKPVQKPTEPKVTPLKKAASDIRRTPVVLQ